MGLTDEERRRLAELADELARDDPRLGRSLSDLAPHTHVSYSHSLDVLVVALLGISMPLVVAGVIVGQPLLAVVGAFSMVAAPTIFVTCRYLRRPPAAPR